VAGLVQEFKAFLLRGNLVELAVAFVMGVAFAALVTAFVTDWITPIIGAIFGSKGAFNDLNFTIHNSVFPYGHFINALITFIAIALAVFFFVVKPVNYYLARARRGQEPEVEKPADVVVLEEIRDLLRRGN
jgi:large conductance mechanosensitive channel